MDTPVSNILALRTRLGLSQSEFAAEVGVDRSTVSRWETGASEPRGPARKLIDRLNSDAVARPLALRGACGAPQDEGTVGPVPDGRDGSDLSHDGDNAADRRAPHVNSPSEQSHTLTVAPAAGEDAP
ncbi:helix-turn-helix domain-containing protein [Jiella pelagia]|uniref:helix-turn-helix domain-containing protein n=1 Tax=Jiella pelagia TaxID=2986949 RepID=UPI0038B35271